ncbi:hypothetical protein L7F22_056849 [Adiantum nelumboides]|nr:hypothetical protein [Adiantum nelumboides]
MRTPVRKSVAKASSDNGKKKKRTMDTKSPRNINTPNTRASKGASSMEREKPIVSMETSFKLGPLFADDETPRSSTTSKGNNLFSNPLHQGFDTDKGNLMQDVSGRVMGDGNMFANLMFTHD